VCMVGLWWGMGEKGEGKGKERGRKGGGKGRVGGC
jgi:hypothetical protein